MNPAELLLTGGIMLGVGVPLTAVVESGRKPADMTRYVMTSDCPGVERCMVDVAQGEVLGLERDHVFNLTID
mgnify:CR=1 FL=1